MSLTDLSQSPAGQSAGDGDLAVSARGVRKVYGPTTALAGADLEVRAGEIHGLLGENGAGKSTLVRLLAGVERPDQGELSFFGEPATGGPKERRQAGLAFIHQNLGLFPDASVAETIALSSGYRRRFGMIDQQATNTSAQAVLDRLGARFKVTQVVGELTLADQTLVAIARALADGARLIVLDEPTAYLEARQVRRLFDILAALRAAGVACVLISHRSEDILRVCDRVTVLRDGRDVARRSTEGLTEADLIRLITGRRVVSPSGNPGGSTPARGRDRLVVRDLCGPGFGPVSLTVAEGEVLGLCGLADAGQFAVGRTLMGDLARTQGTISVPGRPHAAANISAALASGIGFVPADRAREGLAGTLTAAENLLMNSGAHWWRPMRSRADAQRSQELMEAFRVSPPIAQRDVATFSGGNQQKIMLAKWLGSGRSLVILNEPSAGVDIGAKADIHAEIRNTCSASGTSAIVISTDFREIADLCDRALVMRRGHVVGEVDAAHLDANLLAELAYGGRP